MRYYSSAFPVYTSAPGVNYEIFLSGCNKHDCEGCHSPHTWDFNYGSDLEDRDFLDKLLNDIHKYYDRGFVDNIIILGGEPLDNNPGEFTEFIELLKDEFPRCEFYLYTHYTPEDLYKGHNRFYKGKLLKNIDYIKCGRYEKDLPPIKDSLTGVTLASNNQKFYKVENGEIIL